MSKKYIVAAKKGKMLVRLGAAAVAGFDVDDIVEYEGEKYVVLDFTDEVIEQFAEFDMFPPHPVQFYYDWPHPDHWEKVDVHQKITTAFMLRYYKAHVHNEMGTGKTASALWAADWLMHKGKVRKVLIVTTLSTIHDVWGRHILEMFEGRRTFTVLTGSRQRRRRLWALNDTDFYIINHDGLKVICDKIEGDKSHRKPKIVMRPAPEFETLVREIDMVIFDEASVLRNSTTNMYRAAETICAGKRLYLLTGTPSPKAPTDLWAQCRLVRPELVPKYFSHFRNLTMLKAGPFKWVPRKDWQEIVAPMMKPAIRFSLEECVDLPPVTHEFRKVDLNKEQKKAVKDVMSGLLMLSDDELAKVSGRNAAAKRAKVLQIYQGAVYDDEGNVWEFDFGPRYRELKIIKDETDGPLIVLPTYRHVSTLLYEKLKEDGFRVAEVNGDTSKGDRARIFRQFEAGEIDILVAYPDVIAHGLTLTRSNVIVWWGPYDDGEFYEQLNHRIRRKGQTRAQKIIHLYGSAFERRVYENTINKVEQQADFLDMVKQRKYNAFIEYEVKHNGRR